MTQENTVPEKEYEIKLEARIEDTDYYTKSIYPVESFCPHVDGHVTQIRNSPGKYDPMIYSFAFEEGECDNFVESTVIVHHGDLKCTILNNVKMVGIKIRGNWENHSMQKMMAEMSHGFNIEEDKIANDMLNVKIQEYKNDLRTMPYDDYLKTEHWAETSESCKKRDGYKCQFCGFTGNLNAHHKTYANRGVKGKEIHDLITACSDCHGAIHAMLKECGRKII